MPDVTDAAPHAVLQSVFGFDAFRPYQEAIIERVVAGRSGLVVMPTGGGKSLCYQIPALVREGVGIVVSPLIALMKDQVEALQQLGLRAAYLNSSLTRAEQADVKRQLHAGTLDLLYVAPERLMMNSFLQRLDQAPLALIAIDEAHCISEWGHDFRPEYLQLADVRDRFPQVPCLAVTATADEPTRDAILERLQLPEDGLFIAGFDRPNIRYTVVPKRSAKEQLWHFLQANHPEGAGIVYCLSRKRVEQTARWLADKGRAAIPYHAGLDDARRQRHQERFLREDGLIVVATVAFGMGIDKPDVRFVAHLDAPKSLEAYYQETGRAGRDDAPADAWMTYRLSDIVRLRKIMQGEGERAEHEWTQHHKLNALFGYCETTDCRRKVLLNYFGEEMDGDRCGNCDNCLNPVETWDGTVAAQKVLSCVARTDQRFGAGYITNVLRGADTKKIRRFGHDRLSTYGIGEDRSKKAWRSVIRQLVAKGLLRVDVSGYGALQLTEACAPVLRGEQDVAFRRDPAPKTTSTTKKATREDFAGSPADRELYEALRQRRTELARAQEVPPYVIFHDATLRAMAEHRPTTPAAFGQISGVGAVKLERYGKAFMDVIRTANA